MSTNSEHLSKQWIYTLLTFDDKSNEMHENAGMENKDICELP